MGKIFLYVANRLQLIVFLYIVSILISSSLFSYFEQRSFLDGVWWSFVTALTIGYGDISPVTFEGRLVGAIFGHIWIFIFAPMIIGNIITRLLVDKDKFTNAEQEWQESALKAIANKVGVELPLAPRDY